MHDIYKMMHKQLPLQSFSSICELCNSAASYLQNARLSTFIVSDKCNGTSSFINSVLNYLVLFCLQENNVYSVNPILKLLLIMIILRVLEYICECLTSQEWLLKSNNFQISGNTDTKQTEKVALCW